MKFALSSLRVSSPDFADDAPLSARHSQEADDLSPALSWREVPDGTRGIAVICHDPDAPVVNNGGYGYVHWVLYNLPASVTELEEGSKLGTAGVNDGGSLGYCGPMPPQGHGLHRYYFWVLALDTETDYPEGLTLADFLGKVEPHVLGMNRIIGTYRREP
jgi:Raf kinase inhibitor-like YbhB/YbcL family protein|uniref:YbhB/YbcL family Raf kinase inhibitor-like protein n=1 Tax=Halomonas sp. TaxID=1486246 RepID=UPI00261A7FEB|nr:YbhB/YbcL family Raf kinase inhibitor-like protein [Halomonas sp.]